MPRILSRAAIASAVAIFLSVSSIYAQDAGNSSIPGDNASQITTSTADNNPARTNASTEDDGPDLGWIGLAGLLGLAGLMRKDRHDRHDHVDRPTHR